MKRIFIIISLILMALSSQAINYNDKTLMIDLEEQGLFNGLQIYYVKAGTETAASIAISGRNYTKGGDTVVLATVTLTVAGGLRPGTTCWNFSDPAIGTSLSTLESWIEQHDSSATGSKFVQANQPAYLNCFQGEWVITQINSVIGTQPTESLADITSTDVYASTPTTLKLYASSATYFSYTMTPISGKNIAIGALISSITHTGTALGGIYDNSSTPAKITPTICLPTTGLYIYPPTALPGPIAVNYDPTIRIFTEKSNMTEYLTRGYLYLIYKLD